MHKKWLENQKQIHGQFNYLIVPEYHKDGRAIHFHALLANYPGNTVETGTDKNNRRLQNISSYKLGHSTLVDIDQDEQSTNRISNYVRKYITKEMPLFDGKKRYWCSKGLIRPQKVPGRDVMEYDLSSFEKYFEKNRITVYTSKQTEFAKIETNLTQPPKPTILTKQYQLNI